MVIPPRRCAVPSRSKSESFKEKTLKLVKRMVSCNPIAPFCSASEPLLQRFKFLMGLVNAIVTGIEFKFLCSRIEREIKASARRKFDFSFLLSCKRFSVENLVCWKGLPAGKLPVDSCCGFYIADLLADCAHFSHFKSVQRAHPHRNVNICLCH